MSAPKWKWEDPVQLVDGSWSRALVTGQGVPVLRHSAEWAVRDTDAHLIAAAPALYEALDMMLKGIDRAEDRECGAATLARARTALALARGEGEGVERD